MARVHHVSSKDGSAHACLLEVEGNKILALTCMPFCTLKHFKAHNKTEQAEKIGGVYDVVNGEILLKSQTLFDISYLDGLGLLDPAFVIVCDYRDLMILPYLTKRHNFKGKILLTHSMYRMGKLLVEYLHESIANKNRSRQRLEKPDYFEQSEAYDIFEEKYGHRVEDWQPLYTAKEINDMFSKCKMMNFGEVYTDCGLDIIPHSSGTSINTAMWLITNRKTKFSLLFSQNLSTHDWRHCLSAEVKKIQQNRIDVVILGQQCVKDSKTTTNQQLLDFFTEVQKTLKSSSCTVLIDDLTEVMDLLDYFLYRLSSNCKQIYVFNTLIHNFIKYSNSLVEFLNIFLKEKIYSETPTIPFSSYETLFNKGMISVGRVEHVAAQNKIPVKELKIRFQPSLNFQLQLDAIINGNRENCLRMIDRRATDFEISEWLKAINATTVYAFKDLSRIGIRYTPPNSRTQIEGKDISYVKCPNFKGFPIRKHIYKANNLSPFSDNTTIRIIQKDWSKIVYMRLVEWGATVISRSQKDIKTTNSIVTVENYRFSIESNNVEEAEEIFRTIEELSESIHIS